ncbi:apoptotic protease-activating factor 1-like isoform X5 [Amphibalanus amphitrite]|uniref:apoptotic protease-activating factor 1-like isoform X5 n=1 Tax=Amphibalanus amphitrite TaxID=1232801 RepID=UPI001C910C19|nr:apoptotic protease-activating factor 1-like isoform X5 [Amphibalanus amphitrite]XP_043203418.1 apoptotic protease-activating factor 1-like isoform X5 [Amphibalanus amphitrite]
MEDRQRRALQRAHSKLVKDLRVDAVTDHLHSRGVLNEDHLEIISSKPTRKERVTELLKLLPQRGPDAFPALVEALRRNYRWLADELEEYVHELNDSKSEAAQAALEERLRAGAVPSLPAPHITRKQCVAEIRQHLKELKENHFLGVHGMPGIGKSVCMNEALRDTELLPDRFPGGVYWISVGDVDHEALLNKLQALCERLTEDGSTAAQLPPTIEVARERLRKLLNRLERPCLFVLDDVWKAEVLAVFELGACVAVTTRDAAVLDRMDGRSVTVALKGGFSESESRELLATRLGMPPDQLPPEAEVIHRRCLGSPMVIALLSSFLADKTGRRESRNRWHKCLEILEQGKHEKLKTNIMEAIDLTVKTMDEQHDKLFGSLTIFGADIGIPCEVLGTYWDMSADDVEDAMNDLVNKSLVQDMVDSNTTLYSMHDLIFDYLAHKYTSEQKAEMHGKLVERYLVEYGSDLSRLPDDDYTLWFIGQHVHRSGQHHLFPRFYFDLGFVGNKLRVTGPSDLLSDFRKYGEFLDRDSNDNITRRIDFENFVRTAGHRAAGLSKADDPAAAAVQLALCQPDSSEVYKAAERICAESSDQLFFRWRNKEAMRWSNVLLTKLFSGSVWDVVFTYEENLVLAAYGDGHIKLWNMLTGDEHRSFHGHSDRVNQLTVSPSGDRFVSASEDGSLKIWDLDAAIMEALGTDDDQLTVHDASSGQRTPSPRIRHSSSSAFFPESRRPSGLPRLDDSVQTLEGHGTAVACVDWSPDGHYLLSGADNGGVKVWDCFGEEVHSHPTAHEKNVTCCSFSPDSSYFATGSADGKVRLWCTEKGDQLYTFSQHNLRVISLSLSKDNNSIVSVADKEIFLWVWNTDRRPSRDFIPVQMGRSAVDHDLYLCSRLNEDQRLLVVGTSSNMYETWDLQEKRVISTQRGFAGSVTSLVFSRDGKQLLAGADDTVTTCSLTATPKVEDSLQPLFSARFVSADPQSLVVAAITSNNGVQERRDGELTVLRGLEGKVTKTTKPVGEKIIITKINKTGTMVAFGCEDGSVGVYHLPPAGSATQEVPEPNILGKHNDRVISLKFGPNDTVVSGSEDKTMKVWWPDNRSVACGGNGGAVTQVGLYEARDHGLIAVSCSRDGTLKGWRAPVHVRLPRLPSISTADLSESYRTVTRVYRADTGKPITAHLTHAGSTVTCYRIVRANLPDENGATSAATAAARDKSPCPDDLIVVTAGVDGTVKMCRLCTGDLIKSFSLEEFGPVRTFRLSADNHLLVTGHDNGSVVVSRTDHQCKPLRLQFHHSMVNDLAIHPNGREIISLSDSLAWWRLDVDENPVSPRGRTRAGQSPLVVPPSPRLTLPAKRYFNYNRRTSLTPEIRATLRQVFSFRGTLARRLVVSDDWTTLVTIDDAGVLYVLQVM